MSLRVSGKNFQIGEALQEYARSRAMAVADRYFEGKASGHVTLEPEGSGYRCEMILHIDSGMTLHAEGRAQEPYASFDQANQRIETRLRRHKQRIRGRHGASEAAQGRVPMIPDVAFEVPDQDGDQEPFSPIVVAETKRPFRTLSVAAAVEELDLSGVPVLVFRHSGTEHVNLVYRRPDGHIGWIDPSNISA